MKQTFSVISTLLLAVVAVSVAWPSHDQASTAAPQGAKFSVVSTDAAHLIVTDNNSNTLYFYAVKTGGSPGNDLELRGTIDLNGVGAERLKVQSLNDEQKN